MSRRALESTTLEAPPKLPMRSYSSGRLRRASHHGVDARVSEDAADSIGDCAAGSVCKAVADQVVGRGADEWAYDLAKLQPPAGGWRGLGEGGCGQEDGVVQDRLAVTDDECLAHLPQEDGHQGQTDPQV